jgi:membrane AbrB-like protein
MPRPLLADLLARSRAPRWALLLALSFALVAILEAARLPAALLLGCMLAAIAVAARDISLRIPRPLFLSAQAVIGCLMARAITPSILGAMLAHWPLLLATIAAVIAASGALGWLLATLRVLPGATAVWGLSPGAASAMVLMAEVSGADIRLVAFMQYLRVACVSATATAVARLWAPGGGAAPPVVWFPPPDWGPLAGTIALAAAGAIAAPALRRPALALLLPLGLGVTLAGGGVMTPQPPPWLLAISYAVIGWSIGLRFTRAILLHVLLLPRVLLSVAAMMALCGGLGALLARLAGLSPLTAYLATSPGGADAVTIIAASSNVDVPFVVAMQTARFLLVLLIGPRLASLVARHTDGARARPRDQEAGNAS